MPTQLRQTVIKYRLFGIVGQVGRHPETSVLDELGNETQNLYEFNF